MSVARSAVTILVAASLVDGARIRRRKPGSLSACGVKGASSPSSQIVSGQDATECEWRWQASLRHFGGPFCGGTLITPEWVFTSAYCVEEYVRTPNFHVVLGDHNMSATSGHEQNRTAVEVYLHPAYRPRDNDHRNDFALVRLESPVEINDCVGTACLPEEVADVPTGSKCWITGWGTLSNGFEPEVLQEASVDIISNEACMEEYGYWKDSIDDSMICAQGKTPDGKISDACEGDQGGPLVCESEGTWTLYGATSWGAGCASWKYPGVWARVHEVTEWVDRVLSGKAPKTCPDYCSVCILEPCKQCPFCWPR